MLPRLNHDIMVELMGQCASISPSLLLAMMQVSHELYTHGAARGLLLELDIPITSPQQLQSYLAYVTANEGARFGLVKSLHLAIPRQTEIPDGLLACLVKVLPKFSSLERLQIPNLLSQRVDDNRDIAVAIAGLSNIRDLLLDDESSDPNPFWSFVCQILSELRSSLISLDIGWIPSSWNSLHLFRESFDSIRSLTFNDAQLLYDPGNPPVFPRVEMLEFWYSLRRHTLDMRPWSQSFPSVKELSFYAHPHPSRTIYHAPTRETNLAHSRQGLVKWSSLTHIHASVGSLWCSGLCIKQVDRLDLSPCFHPSSEDMDDLKALPTVLEDVNPRTVAVCLEIDELKRFEPLRSVLQHSAWYGVRKLLIAVVSKYDCPSTLIRDIVRGLLKHRN